MAPPRSSLAPILVAALIMVIWGATPVATRLAVADLDPLFVGLLRTVFAGALALPVALALHQSLPKDGRSWLLLVISGAEKDASQRDPDGGKHEQQHEERAGP